VNADAAGPPTWQRPRSLVFPLSIPADRGRSMRVGRTELPQLPARLLAGRPGRLLNNRLVRVVGDLPKSLRSAAQRAVVAKIADDPVV
jgi:hypothetical protein